jgi:hypothetical protein
MATLRIPPDKIGVFMENTYPSQPTKSLTDDEQFELCSLVAYLKLDVSEFTDFELAKRYSKQVAELCRQFGAHNAEGALRDKGVGARLPAHITRVLCSQIEWWKR